MELYTTIRGESIAFVLHELNSKCYPVTANLRMGKENWKAVRDAFPDLIKKDGRAYLIDKETLNRKVWGEPDPVLLANWKLNTTQVSVGSNQRTLMDIFVKAQHQGGTTEALENLFGKNTGSPDLFGNDNEQFSDGYLRFLRTIQEVHPNLLQGLEKLSLNKNVYLLNGTASSDPQIGDLVNCEDKVGYIWSICEGDGPKRLKLHWSNPATALAAKLPGTEFTKMTSFVYGYGNHELIEQSTLLQVIDEPKTNIGDKIDDLYIGAQEHGIDGPAFYLYEGSDLKKLKTVRRFV